MSFQSFTWAEADIVNSNQASTNEALFRNMLSPFSSLVRCYGKCETTVEHVLSLSSAPTILRRSWCHVDSGQPAPASICWKGRHKSRKLQKSPRYSPGRLS